MPFLRRKEIESHWQQVTDRLFLGILAIVLGCLAWSGNVPAEQTSPGKGELLSVEGVEDSGKLQVFIKVKNPVDHKAFVLAGPHRLVINLAPCGKGPQSIPDMTMGPVLHLRSSQFNDDTVRLVLDLERPVSYTVSTQQGDPFLLIVTFTGEGRIKAGPDKTTSPQAQNSEKKPERGSKKTLSGSREMQKKPAVPDRPIRLAASPRDEVPGLTGAEQALKAGDFPGAVGMLKKIQGETLDKNTWTKTGQPLLQQALAGQIEKLFEKGDHREVLRLFGLHRESLGEGADPKLLQNVGNSYKALGLYDPAVRYFQAAWQGGAQGSPALVLDWAEALAGQGKAAEAASLVQNLLDRPAGAAPDQPGRALRLLVRCLVQQRLYLEAYKTLEAAGRRNPRWEQDPENRFLQGIVCFEIPGMGPKALQALRQFTAAGLDPGRTALAYEKIGDLSFADKQFEEAWRAYYQALRLQPEVKGTYLAKKLTQCRLLVEERRRGSLAENGSGEMDPFWKRLQEHRSAQEKLENKVSELRLN